MFSSILCIPLVAFLKYYNLIENGKARLRFYFRKCTTGTDRFTLANSGTPFAELIRFERKSSLL